MTRDMRPYQAGHDYVLPDQAAETLIAAGDAVPAKPAADSIVLPPDEKPAGRGPLRYLTRKTGR